MKSNYFFLLYKGTARRETGGSLRAVRDGRRERMKDHFGEKENKKQGNFSKKTGYMILIYKGAVFRIITKNGGN